MPKQLLLVAGRSLLERSVGLFANHLRVDEIVVALPPEHAANPPSFLIATTGTPIRVVVGGARRQDSVANAFQAIDRRAEVVVIHDAARPFASGDLINRTIDAAAEYGAALAAVQSRDTVKRARTSGGPDLFVEETLARETIYLAQTPQAFRRAVLAAAIAVAGDVEATDEASLAERAGHAVRIVDGEWSNIKVTTPEDLAAATAIDGWNAAPELTDRMTRIGTGYDLHRLVEGRPLVLGGIVVPHDRGPLGHSDADVVCHSVTDAVLGAASLGDIGRHFPDTDPRWKGASSLDLLRRAVALVAAKGFTVVNVDVTVVLERPKIKDHIDAMRSAVAAAIGIDPGQVGIKGKTNEGVDAVGRGEAIAAHAVALLDQRLDTGI